MEKWIKKNQAKLILLGGILAVLSLYGSVHGGRIIPRINNLENGVAELKTATKKLMWEFWDHEDKIHYGQ